MNEATVSKPTRTGKIMSAARAIAGRSGIGTLSAALKTALVVTAFATSAYPTAALEIERKFEVSEKDLTQQLAPLTMIFKQVWVDIRSEPKVFNGRTYSGFISIHARDQQNRYCRWDTAFDEVLKDFEPPFNPIPVNAAVSTCAEWSNWVYIDKAIGDWVVVKVHPYFANFDGMPIMSNISAKGYYYPDKLVLVMRLRTVKMQGEFDKQLDKKLLLDPKLLKK